MVLSFKKLFISFLSAILVMTSLSGQYDLEDSIQSFVIETKKIDVPGFPNAFNPSIVRWQGQLLMSFRTISSLTPLSTGCLNGLISQIGLVWLDDDFNAISVPEILDLSSFASNRYGREEDARLVIAGDKLFIIFSDNKNEYFSDGGFRVYSAELICNEEGFSVTNIRAYKHFEGENPMRREKNWSPFDYQGELHFIYTVNPHLIFKPAADIESCDTVSKTVQSLTWSWGDPRGGTPALKINEHSYLSFFHSLKTLTSLHSEQEHIDHYFMGAYTFSATPPFQITSISPEPIIGPNFYHGMRYEYYWRPIVVVFPCGYIFDEDFIWVFYGRQDHEVWAVKLDKQSFLDSLVILE